MATIAKLIVELGLEDGAFQRGIQGTRDKLDNLGSSFRGWGTKLTAGVTTPIVGAGLAAVNWASDLEQAMGKSDAVFGAQSNAVIQWSKTTADSYGFAQSESLAMASTFGALFKVVGMTNEKASEYSMGLIGLSADMAAFNDVSNSRASEAIMSGLSGEYMSLRSMGVFLNEATVSERALAIAVADGRSEVTEADKVQARYNLIMEQTAQQQGQAEKESTGWAASIARLRARLKDAGAAIGQKLMPHALKLVDTIMKLIDRFSKLSDRTQFIIIAVAAFAAALGPVLLIIGLMLPGISALVAVVGFLLSPVGLIIIAIALLAAGLIYAYTHFESFRNVVDAVASAIKGGAIAAFDALVAVFDKLKSAFDAGGWSGMFSKMGEMLLNGLQQLSDLAAQGIQALADKFIAGAGSMLSAGASWLQGLWNGAVSVWNSVTGWLGGLASSAITWLGDMIGTLYQKGVDLFTGFSNGVAAIWLTISTWFGTLGTLVFTAIGDLLMTITSRGTDILQGFYSGVLAKWIAVSTWFTSLGTMVFSAIGSLVSTIKSRGTDILQGFWQGVLDKWIAVSTWFINLGLMVFGAIADVASTIQSKGTDILGGFWTGVLDKWVSVSTWFVGLGGMIVGAVGDIAGSLYNAGLSVMQGLWDGLSSKWGEITSWLSGLNPADWKGPERRDKKMLLGPGLWIMEGLGNGLERGWHDVTRQLSGYVPTIDAGAMAGIAMPSLSGVRNIGRPTVIDNSQVHYVALNDAQFAELLQAKERTNKMYNSTRDPNALVWEG